MDRIEQLHRFGRLVRLQPANAVQPHGGIASQQRRPFLQGFLHAAFAEVLLAGGDQLFDLDCGPRLADGDELDVRGIAPGKLRSDRDRVQDFPASVGSTAHRLAL